MIPLLAIRSISWATRHPFALRKSKVLQLCVGPAFKDAQLRRSKERKLKRPMGLKLTTSWIWGVYSTAVLQLYPFSQAKIEVFWKLEFKLKHCCHFSDPKFDYFFFEHNEQTQTWWDGERKTQSCFKFAKRCQILTFGKIEDTTFFYLNTFQLGCFQAIKTLAIFIVWR